MGMGTISAKKINDALAKARAVGVVEEPLTLGDMTLVFRNLRPDQFTAVYEENKEREGIDHLWSFQKSHLCRSLVEVNGIDFRDVDFIEVEEEIKDPKTGEPILDPSTGTPKVKKIKLERHAYVRQYLLDEWSKEILQVAWRKFNDVLKLAEDKSKEGVKFVLPEMTPEESLREHINNVREVLDEVPEAISDSILEDAGLMRISKADEIKRATEQVDALAREQEAKAKAEAQAQASPQEAPPQVVSRPPIQLDGAPPTGPRVRQATPEEIMARRTPLNQQPIVETPVQQPAIAAVQMTSQGSPQPPTQVSGVDATKVIQRSQNIARLEAETVDLEVPLPPPGDPAVLQRTVPHGQALPNAPHLMRAAPSEVPILQKGRDQVDMQAFQKSVDKPPTAGLNPRFRPVRR